MVEIKQLIYRQEKNMANLHQIIYALSDALDLVGVMMCIMENVLHIWHLKQLLN